ncbi:hypothetical protein BgAZ_105470 [Babesia gibsoni]|uniref:t-SNARE coiled-coil homology domain-containing protein n=1 Tax=Babesia gibsoni TaxID=33632 RepID=A0AAD8UTD9_BABGI|nr:hypothetical protein BgAZ_105470 [Babesia gibsoni]
MVHGVDRTKLFLQEVARNSTTTIPAASTAGEISQLDVDVNSISIEISKCSAKLSELAALARKRSIYVDHTAEIERLTGDVKEIINIISNGIDEFEKTVGRMRYKNEHTRKHYENLLASLRKRLYDLTKTFKDTLYQRAQIMIQQESRRRMYSHNDGDHKVNSTSQGRKRFSLQQSLEGDQLVDIESGEMERPSRSVVADAKAEALANVQRAIGELSQIFHRVTTLVSQQDEMIQRIDADTVTSLDNVISAQSDLARYYKRISNNRTLIAKVFFILVAFIIVFILFLM